MQIFEVSPETRPDLFFLPRDTGEVGSQGAPILAHDKTEEEVTAYTAAKALRKRSVKGFGDLVFRDDRIEIYDAGVLVAEARLVGQVLVQGIWNSQPFVFSQADITHPTPKIYRAIIQRNISGLDVIFGQQVEWTRGRAKQTFYLDVPGRTVRLKWQMRLYVPEDAQPDGSWRPRGLRYSIADYTGASSHTRTDNGDGTIDHVWTFEPLGKLCDVADARTLAQRFQDAAGLLVDPYLSVDENSTTVDVGRAGVWGITFDSAQAGSPLYRWYSLEDGAGSMGDFYGFSIMDYGQNWTSGTPVVTLTVVWSTSVAVCIRVLSSIDGNYSEESFFWVYDCVDHVKIFRQFTFDRIANNSVGTPFFEFGLNNIVNWTLMADGLANDPVDLTVFNGDWIATFQAGAGSIIFVPFLLDSDTELQDLNALIRDSRGDRHGIQCGSSKSFAVGNQYRSRDCMILGSGADGQSLLYFNSAADVDPLVNDLLDTTLPALTTGSWAADLNYPINLGTSGFSVDGGHHAAPDASDDLVIPWDRVRKQPSVIVHDFPVLTGASPGTDHLVESWNCDSLTTDLGGQTVTLSGTPPNITTIGQRGNCLSVKAISDRAYFPCNTTLGNINNTKGTVEFWRKFTGSTSTDWVRMFEHDLGTNYLNLERNGAVGETYRFRLGGTTSHINFPGIVELWTDPDVWHFHRIGWDADLGIVFGQIDGLVLVNTGLTIVMNALSTGNLYVGTARPAAGNYSSVADVDQFRIYDRAILPFGAMVPGNIESDYSDAHSSITLYSDDGSTLRIGTTSLTDIANVSNTAGSLAMWVNPTVNLTADEVLWSGGTDFLLEYIHATTEIRFTYGSGVTISALVSSGLVGPIYIRIGWEANDKISLVLNGDKATPVAAGTAPVVGASMSWSSNVVMTHNTITNTPATPDLPFALGAGPLWAPKVSN